MKNTADKKTAAEIKNFESFTILGEVELEGSTANVYIRGISGVCATGAEFTFHFSSPTGAVRELSEGEKQHIREEIQYQDFAVWCAPDYSDRWELRVHWSDREDPEKIQNIDFKEYEARYGSDE